MNHGLKSRGLVVARPALASAAPMSSHAAAAAQQQQQQLQVSASATVAPTLATHAMAAAKSSHPPGWKLWHHSHGIKFGSLLPPQPRPLPLEPGCFASHRALHTLSDGTPWESESVGSGLSTSTGWVDERKTVSTLFRGVAEALTPSDRAPPTTEVEDGAAEENVPEDEAAKKSVPEDEDVDPPATTLDYKFPPEAFRQVRRAPPDTPASFWSYSYYRGPGDEKVKVHYCRSRDTTERVCRYFLDEKLLGFDLEWAPDANKFSGPRRNVALVQLASQSRIALFHLALYPRNEDVTDVSPSLRRIMEDPAITKCGVSIKADCTRLRNYLNIHSQGVFELSHLFRLVKYSRTGETRLINKRLVSLAEQTQTVLGLPLYKGVEVRWSGWSKPLQMDQILYSASDAYAAVQIYDVLEQQRQSLKPTPPRPYHCELELPIRLAEPEPDESDEEEAVVDEAEEAEEVVVAEEVVEEAMAEGEELAAAEEVEELVVEDEDKKDLVVVEEEEEGELVVQEGELPTEEEGLVIEQEVELSTEEKEPAAEEQEELVAEEEELATKEEGLAIEQEMELAAEEQEPAAEESSGDEPAELGADAAVEPLERTQGGRRRRGHAQRPKATGGRGVAEAISGFADVGDHHHHLIFNHDDDY
ncbi:hypothetical protein MAPG_03894 [Magnaporthiopsis poae ATCC 64411]|uniref:3'-5' exonuclease domain-containing protein n=1 Tax=Magnaporthiopsis poae (strain ATCC 64411 / 73-15) TaxID=644358 RepID=A0A0C4DV93_MAGP6|nr:hypothetical protein MAPG_03894 [Magnaporthiopsis poae ATCC 64411]